MGYLGTASAIPARMKCESSRSHSGQALARSARYAGHRKNRGSRTPDPVAGLVW